MLPTLLTHVESPQCRPAFRFRSALHEKIPLDRTIMWHKSLLKKDSPLHERAPAAPPPTLPSPPSRAIECSLTRSLLQYPRYDWRITIVDNGSVDQTLKVAQSLESERVRCTHLAEKGRGRALKHAWDGDDSEVCNRSTARINTLSNQGMTLNFPDPLSVLVSCSLYLFPPAHLPISLHLCGLPFPHRNCPYMDTLKRSKCCFCDASHRLTRACMHAHVAQVQCYMDVDLSTNLTALPVLIDTVASGEWDAAAGSRRTRGASVTTAQIPP